jgi:hypothetical protein
MQAGSKPASPLLARTGKRTRTHQDYQSDRHPPGWQDNTRTRPFRQRAICQPRRGRNTRGNRDSDPCEHMRPLRDELGDLSLIIGAAQRVDQSLTQRHCKAENRLVQDDAS